jgi:hypothetical protein
MADDVSFKNLLDQSLDAGDPFLAAACHPYANPQDRRALEGMLFATSKLKRQFAGAMYTPASALDSLAADSDKRIRLRVAKHPAAAPATLANLARAETAEDLCARVAGHRNTPRDMLENLYKKHPNSPEIRRALCHNPHTPGPLLQRLAVGAAPAELKGVARNPEADDALLRLCWDTQDAYLQAEVAAHPNCALDLRDSAECAPQALVRRKLAQNPALSDTVLLRLLSDAEAQVRAAAVRHLSAPRMAELDSGGCDPSRQVRRDQARHKGLPLSWINRLAQDTDSWVRRLIASNQSTPEQALRSLAGDAVMQVRRGVARNPACPAKLLQRLARDPHPWVRAGVALRGDIAKPLIIKLSRDDDIDVLSALGKNPGSPRKILERITCHENRDVRRSVILNRNTPRRVLRGLLEDPYPPNRVLLAGHRNLVNADLHGLLHDPEPTVRFAGAQALAARLR